MVDITGRAHVVDARPAPARGDEPFEAIMAAAAAVGADEVLVVYAPFDPVPLQGILGGQGFGCVVDELDGGDWRATLVRG